MANANKCYFIFTLITTCVILAGCSKPALSGEEFAQWCLAKENGLIADKKIGDLRFSVQYKPHELIVCQELRGAKISPADFKKRVNELSGMEYFTFRINSEGSNDVLAAGIESEEEYYGRLEYFIGPMQDDLMMIDGADTISCGLYHFERTYGLSPTSTFVLGFHKGKATAETQKDRVVLFNDRVLGTGPILLTIINEDITSIPHLLIQ